VQVAHLEAGLRSDDWSMPEEINRVLTDAISDLLFCTEQSGVDNLRREGVAAEKIHLVGNVMIDTLNDNAERATSRHILRDLGLEPRSYGVLTMHRPSNVDVDAVLSSLLGTLREVATTLPLVFPVHPRVSDRIRSDWEAAGIRVIAPLGYLDFLSLQSQAAVMLTDSGGIQEETTVLGIPCLTLRENTERPITVTEGTNRLVGWDRQAIVDGVADALAGRTPIRKPQLWDGRASARVCDALLGIDCSAFPRPTST
jgi:UDP-N-acetylglucosamine 2-epimerase (non-hydrolysing)